MIDTLYQNIKISCLLVPAWPLLFSVYSPKCHNILESTWTNYRCILWYLSKGRNHEWNNVGTFTSKTTQSCQWQSSLCVFSLPTLLVMIKRIYIYIYTLSYYHHQIGSMNYYPLFRVRSWNNGVRCMSFYTLSYWNRNVILMKFSSHAAPDVF